MVEQVLKWYGIFMALFTTILSFADPVTDILTLVVFYREDHKTWFGVGLVFVVLPCLVYPVIYYLLKEIAIKHASRARRCTRVFLCGFNPFSPAFAKLQMFMFYLKNFKKLWRGDKIQPASFVATGEKEALALLIHSKFALLFEATLESAPQFVLQLYATSVQQKSVKIIQMISLPVSFLSLAWASTVADEVTFQVFQDIRFYGCNVKNKLLLFATHLFLLSSRLFAISLFTVSYKWWITSVLIFHSVAILVADAVWRYRRRECDVRMANFSAFFSCLHWLRDDMSTRMLDADKDNGKLFGRMQLFSNLLFVIENIVMILSFYFSQSKNWYALPVTVCVCLFSVLGAIMRITHFNRLIKTIIRESRNVDKYISTSLVRFSNEEYRGYAVQSVQYVSTV